MEPSPPAAGPSLHPLLEARRTQRAFDPHAELTEAELAVLLEAARWAPSSFNTQPWRFLVGRRGTDLHQRIIPHLSPRNQKWAGRAGVLLIGAHLTRAETGRPLRYAEYDLGQAMALMTIQAVALRLSLCQMEGFQAGDLHADLGLPEDIQVKVVAAVGRLGPVDDLPVDLRGRETAPRSRHPMSTLLLTAGPVRAGPARELNHSSLTRS